MAGTFVLPLFPLREAVLLPGEAVHLPLNDATAAAAQAADGYGGGLVASLVDGDAVHEVGVTALVEVEPAEHITLRGVGRCRLLSLVDETVPLVKAERFPEVTSAQGRGNALARLLRRRYRRLFLTLGKKPESPLPRGGLSILTWRLTATLDLTTEQQQGFLNVPDALTRGKLLLAVVREFEKRERFLRRWAHLRTSEPWN